MNTLCRGLVGYVSYLAPCRSAAIYTEYLLYQPILRIAQAQGYDVKSEVAVEQGPRGDACRIDFAMRKASGDKNAPWTIGVEVKWPDRARLDCSRDAEKLNLFVQQNPTATGYLLVFGTGKIIENVRPALGKAKIISMPQKPVRWPAGKTDYAASWFRVA